MNTLSPVQNTLPTGLTLNISIFCYYVFLKILTKWRLFLHIAFMHFFFHISVRYGRKHCKYEMIQKEGRKEGKMVGGEMIGNCEEKKFM
jgi:hypothetical protein